MCSKVECCTWVCAQECRRWDFSVSLWARKQHFDGTTKTFSDQIRFDKNQKCNRYHRCDRSVHRRTNKHKVELFKLTIFTFFAALLSESSMGCTDAMEPEPLKQKHAVNCLNYEENTKKTYNDGLCIFRALASHFHENGCFKMKLRHSSHSS